MVLYIQEGLQVLYIEQSMQKHCHVHKQSPCTGELSMDNSISTTIYFQGNQLHQEPWMMLLKKHSKNGDKYKCPSSIKTSSSNIPSLLLCNKHTYRLTHFHRGTLLKLWFTFMKPKCDIFPCKYHNGMLIVESTQLLSMFGLISHQLFHNSLH